MAHRFPALYPSLTRSTFTTAVAQPSQEGSGWTGQLGSSMHNQHISPKKKKMRGKMKQSTCIHSHSGGRSGDASARSGDAERSLDRVTRISFSLTSRRAAHMSTCHKPRRPRARIMLEMLFLTHTHAHTHCMQRLVVQLSAPLYLPNAHVLCPEDIDASAPSCVVYTSVFAKSRLQLDDGPHDPGGALPITVFAWGTSISYLKAARRGSPLPQAQCSNGR